jgi:hypothetical protein
MRFVSWENETAAYFQLERAISGSPHQRATGLTRSIQNYRLGISGTQPQKLEIFYTFNIFRNPVRGDRVSVLVLGG